MATLREQRALAKAKIAELEKDEVSGDAIEAKKVAEQKAYEDWMRQDIVALNDEIYTRERRLRQQVDRFAQLNAKRDDWDPDYPGLSRSNSPAPPVLSLAASPRHLEIEAAPQVITPLSNPRLSKDESSAAMIPPSVAGTRSSLRPVARGMATPGFIVASNANDDVFGIDNQPEESVVHYDDNDDDYVAPAGDDYQDPGRDFQDDLTVDPSGSDSGLVLEDTPSTVSSGLSSGLLSGSQSAPPPVFGANAPRRQFSPKYLAASVVDKASLVRVMPANMEREADGKFKRDYLRTDAIMDYGLEERMALYSYGWNPDALDNDVFAAHSDEGHLISAMIADRDGLGTKIQDGINACTTPYGPGPDHNCCPRVPSGLPASYTLRYQCPDAGCQGINVKLSIAPYRLAAMCKLPDKELWKMLLPRNPTTKCSSSNKAYEASAICNEFSGDNHCVRHVVMETKYHNGLRASQHGATRSFQASPANPTMIGTGVRLSWTEGDHIWLDQVFPGPIGPKPRPQRKTDLTKLDQTCEYETCTKTTGTLKFCPNHKKKCDEDGCDTRMRTVAAFCSIHKRKSLCRADGCERRAGCGEDRAWCGEHGVECAAEHCNARTKINNGKDYCDLHKNGMGRICRFEGCEKPARCGEDKAWCGDHSVECSREHCNARTKKRKTNSYCDLHKGGKRRKEDDGEEEEEEEEDEVERLAKRVRLE
jgi:hypothetical protein